jgi:8-oxo-dGTP diphosphatase
MDHINDNSFQVSVKGLYINKEGKFLMIKEEDGTWEIPGGRIQKGEDFIGCLERECFEETSLECQVLGEQPVLVYPSIDSVGRGRIMVYFKVNFKNFEFKPSPECIEIDFFDKKDLEKIKTNPQIKLLANYLPI